MEVPKQYLGVIEKLRETSADNEIWVCEECGCPDIDERMWVNANTNENSVSCEDPYVFCANCDEYVSWVTLYIYRRRPDPAKRASQNIELPSPEILAAVFSNILGEWYNTQEKYAIIMLNKERSVGSCATHDFADPNQAMIDALEVCGVSWEPSPLVNNAWGIAKENDFWFFPKPQEEK